MAWKPEKNLPHRSPFKKPTYGPGGWLSLAYHGRILVSTG